MSDEETDREGCGVKHDKDKWTQMEKYWFQKSERMTVGNRELKGNKIRKKNGRMYKKTQ